MNAHEYETTMRAIVTAGRSLEGFPVAGMIKAGVPKTTPELVIEPELWKPGKRDLTPWIELAGAAAKYQAAFARFMSWQRKPRA